MSAQRLPTLAREGLRIALLARNEVTRQGLKAILGSTGLVRHVQFCDEAERFFADPENKAVDVVIISSDDAGLEGARQLATDAERNGVKVLLLLGQNEERSIEVVATVPSNGFLLTTEINADTLRQALSRTVDGDLPMPPALANRLLAIVRRRPNGSHPKWVNLTGREREALQLLAEGLSNKQIARQLGISLHGAKRLVANVLAKLNCPNRTLAATMALSAGLLPASGHDAGESTP